jgi:hypothetical protein
MQTMKKGLIRMHPSCAWNTDDTKWVELYCFWCTSKLRIYYIICSVGARSETRSHAWTVTCVCPRLSQVWSENE